MIPRPLIVPAVVLGILCASGATCRPTAPRAQLVDRMEREARLSNHQLRVLLNDFVIRFAARIESDADHILSQTDDPAVRRNALRWKINAIAAGYRAGFRKHPLGSYLDLSILNKQMAQLFTSPAGHALFGSWQPVAVGTCRDLERQLAAIEDALGRDLPLNEQFARNFAAEHPVTDLYFDRESLAARYIGEIREPSGELIQAVGHLQEDLGEFKRLAATYAEHLPKQARWEAELMLLDAGQTAIVRQPLQDLARTSDAITRLAAMSEQLPRLVERERDALQGLVRTERQAIMHELDRMRWTSVEDLRRERRILLRAAQNERRAISEQLERHVAEAITATDQISQRRVHEAADHGEQLIDHAFLKTAQLLAGLAALSTLALFCTLYARRARPRRTTRPRRAGTVGEPPPRAALAPGTDPPPAETDRHAA